VLGYLGTIQGADIWQESDEISPTSTPGAVQSMLALNDTVYEFGDMLRERIPSATVWKTRLEYSGTAPTLRWYHGLAGIDDKIFVYGGCTVLQDATTCIPSSYSDTFKQFQVSTKVWSTIGPRGDAPGRRAFFAMASASDNIYLHGGLTGRYVGNRNHLVLFIGPIFTH
jgi:hypothetical protein